MSSKRYLIAFSFAGEKREFVAKVAELLGARFGRKRILYDKFHEATFARSDLGIHLPDLYYNESELVVLVICKDYQKKEWCGLEWTAIHALIKERKVEDVMLCRFEHALIKGLYSTAGFVDLDRKKPEEAAELILQRLKDSGVDTRKRRARTSDATPNTPSITPNNLPRLQSFFGRSEELKKIAVALSPNTRTWGVLIDGPGGIGKTSLAIRAAELVTAGQFSQIFFLSSKERKLTAEGEKKLSDFVTPGYLDMLNEIARLLKQPELSKKPEAERARLLIDALVPAKALLILDNLESMPKSQQNRLFEFLSQLPLGCKAIVTSRVRTDVDARIMRLAKLDPDAALALIADLATDRPLLAKATAEEHFNLYEETGGNPLLIRWIGGQLGRGQCRTIDSALDLLRRAAEDNDPLEFIFGDLLGAFTENETRVLAALTYFTQQVEVKLIAELASISKTAAETALGDLSNRALVIPDEEERRFALVPMVADFLRRKRPQAVAETGDRLQNRAVALIVENGYRHHDRFPLLDADWHTIAPALSLFKSGSNSDLQTICTALVDFLHFTGRWDELLWLNLHAEVKAEAEGERQVACRRAYYAGCVHRLRQEADEVLACADRAAFYMTNTQSAREHSMVLQLQGAGYHLKGDYHAAILAYRQALELDRVVSPNSADVGSDLNDLADAERLSGDLDTAEQHYVESLSVAREVGSAQGVAVVTGNLALLALDRQDWQAAETYSREAVALSEKLGSQQLIASNCNRLANALTRMNRQDDAIPYAERAVKAYTLLCLASDLEAARQTLEECMPAIKRRSPKKTTKRKQ